MINKENTSGEHGKFNGNKPEGSGGTSSTKSCKGNLDKEPFSPKKSQKFNFDYDDEKRKMEDEEKQVHQKYSNDPVLFRSNTEQPNKSILSPVLSKRNDLKSSILTLNHPQ